MPRIVKPRTTPAEGRAVVITPGAYPPPPVVEGEPVEPVLSRAVRAKASRAKQAAGPKQLDSWNAAQQATSRTSYITGLADRGRQKLGHSAVYVGDESDALVQVIDVPSIALEFFLGQNGWPLSLIYQIVSETGSFKSAFLAEVGRWFYKYGGFLSVMEAESKFNPEWYRSILGRQIFRKDMPLYRCDSIDGWQDSLTFAITDLQQYMIGTKGQRGPGRVFPACFGVDSVMGKGARESADKILGKLKADGARDASGKGSAGRDFPVEAGNIAKYMRNFPELLNNWPFCVVLVNHLRLNKNEMGGVDRNKAGGKQIDFQESFEIELTKKTRKPISCADWQGHEVHMTLHKNSFSGGGRMIATRILWWHEPDEKRPGKYRQKTVWDWDWSTVWTLNQLRNSDYADPYFRACLRGADFHIECTKSGDIENLAWSRNLGMKNAKSAVPWAELGRLIREDAALIDTLRGALRLTERKRFSGDFSDRLADIRRGTAKKKKGRWG